MFGLAREERLVLIHALDAALEDHAGAIGDQHVVTRQTQRLEQLQARDRGGASARGHQLDLIDALVDQLERVDDGGRGNDRGAVLIVVKHRDLHAILELLLDKKALRCLDVLEVDAAEGRLQAGDDIDQLVGIVLGDLDIEDIDAGELLKQHRFAFHHRLGRERPDVAEPEHGGAVGDDPDQITAVGV